MMDSADRRRLLWVPALINAVLLILFVGLGVWGGMALFAFLIPAGTLTSALAIGAGILLGLVILIMGILFFSATTLIIGAPWYGDIARAVLHEAGMITKEVSAWQEIQRGIVYTIQLILLFLLGHTLLLLINVLPGIGSLIYAIGVILLGALLLAFEFFGEAFTLQGERFPARVRLLLTHPVSVAAFALPLVLLLLIPGVHILVPPFAVAAAGKLYAEWKGSEAVL